MSEAAVSRRALTLWRKRAETAEARLRQTDQALREMLEVRVEEVPAGWTIAEAYLARVLNLAQAALDAQPAENCTCGREDEEKPYRHAPGCPAAQPADQRSRREA